MSFFEISNPNLYVAIVLSILNAVLLCFAGYKFLQIIQLSGYRIQSYRTWLKDTKFKYIGHLAILAFLSFACMLITLTIFDAAFQNISYYGYIGIGFYIYFGLVFVLNRYNAPKKTPLKQTHRMNRLMACVSILTAGITFVLIWVFTSYVPQVRFTIIALTPILLPFIIPIAHLIMVPFENLNCFNYVKASRRKLSKRTNLIKIGITGSYGKTTTKYILNTILSEKYNVCFSPHSFNTPMGLSKVVLDYLKPEHEVLIAELGASQRGDIWYLCTIIKPQYGIITSIGTQHFSSFGSYENLKRTKYELVENLDKNGLMVFNGSSPHCKELFEKCPLEKVYSQIDEPSAFASADKIEISENGMKFNLKLDGESIRCKTKLLGLHNLENILTCTALAKKLGLTIQQIATGISKLAPVAHRLELKHENGLTILDDSFNSCVEGSKAAMEVLKLFSGGKKIVITPGLVELGSLEKEENINLAKRITETADRIIFVNKTNKEYFIEGIEQTEFPTENIFYVDTLAEALLKLKEISASGDIVLFENDLPDNFT